MDPVRGISEHVLRFGLRHEREVKRRALVLMAGFFEATSAETYVRKFRKGAKEHGDITSGALRETDWNTHLSEEFVDAFWYACILMYGEYEVAGELDSLPVSRERAQG